MAPKTGDKVQQKSPAEFFADNKNIAGFDNPGKSLYTTIRELVENALDSAESIQELPQIEVTVEEVSQKQLDEIRGVENKARVDEKLYHDFETEEEKKKREAKEAREVEKLAKLAAKKGEGAAAAEARRKELESKKAAKGRLYYRVTLKDNGSGMPHKDIPNMLGRVLSGTKYGVKQTRGKFGLGAKMALIWSKMTTGLPFHITSAKPKQDFKSNYVLDIDIHRNEPNVHKCEKLPNHDGWHGTELSVTIAGNWQYYRAKVVKYLRQIAVITPYAQFVFTYTPSEGGAGGMRVAFRRRAEVMPPAPRATKHHPASVDLELVKRLCATTTQKTLVAFLRNEFVAISKQLAERLVAELGVGASGDVSPRSLESRQMVRLYQLFHEVRFPDPRGDHLSPAGEYNLRLGVLKELHPDLIATYQGDVKVFEGHPFIVEAAVSVGGRELKPGINVYRFANRIPLLFEAGNDVVTRTATRRINWQAYKINQHSDKVGVFVSIVSTKIPFKGAGKEYIGDDVEEMVAAVKQAIQQCCLQLKSKIARAIAAREQKQRKRNLTKYIAGACSALWGVMQAMARDPPHGAKRRRLQEEHELLSEVRKKRVAYQTLVDRLTEHVERIDTDLALEYQVQLGMAASAKEDIFLAPADEGIAAGPELHANTCIVHLLTAAA